MAGEIDYYEANADWLHTKWTWPPYGTAKFQDSIALQEISIEKFKKLPAYLEAVKSGLIVSDEWTGVEVDWSEPWIRGVDLEFQMRIRMDRQAEEIIGVLADAQGEANRILTQEETGLYLVEYIERNLADTVEEDGINVEPADVSGIDGLVRLDQGEVWSAVLMNYSSFMTMKLAQVRLPEIWQKPGARAVYYPERNLIVVPNVSTSSLPQVSHAASHFIETLGKNLDAADLSRNSLALPGTLHLVRPGLYSLRGPWIDQHDGVLRGYNKEWLEEQYVQRKYFTEKEIRRMFKGRPSEYLAMIAQRVSRKDPVELATQWSRNPEQLLFYLTLVSGNYMEKL